MERWYQEIILLYKDKAQSIPKAKQNLLVIIEQNIRKYRLKIDISQENLAMSAGLYPAYLGRLERGEKCPTIDTLYKISCALGITINELICFDSKIDSSPTNNQAKMRIEEALKQIPDTQQLRIAEIVENIAVIIKEEKNQ